MFSRIALQVLLVSMPALSGPSSSGGLLFQFKVVPSFGVLKNKDLTI